MIIERLVLKNIRSYEEETIDFPQGSVLLSGDVGSGKTTILLAIEFALFGILRGELAADHLLRHGAKQGKVTLTFTIQDHRYTVERTLIKGSKGVKQGPGHLTVDGETEPLTPVELKARILVILGYPKDLVTKAKSWLYRYAVYTPQEEMKRILEDDKDARLTLLRKVFSFDQYARITQNAQLIQKELRARMRAIAVQLEELPLCKEDLRKTLSACYSLAQECVLAQDLLEKSSVSLKRLQHEEERLAEKVRFFEEQKTKENELLALLTQLDRELAIVTQRITEINEEQAESHEKRPIMDKKDQEEKLQQAQRILQQLEQKRTGVVERRAVVFAKLKHSAKEHEALAQMGSHCPVCKQDITTKHRSLIAEEQRNLQSEMTKQLAEMDDFLTEIKTRYDNVAKKERLLHEQVIHARALMAEQKRREERMTILEKRKKDLTAECARIQEQQAVTQQNLKRVQESLKAGRALESEASAHKRKVLEAQAVFQQASIRQAESQALLDGKLTTYESVLRQRNNLLRLQNVRDRWQVMLHWIGELFLPLVIKIEKTLFGQVHQACAAALSGWAAKLLQSDELSTHLHHDFSVHMVQNGYEMEVSALSGGERTAVALAYRLALQQVISGFVELVQTRELLILDEPTEGFSSEQLERFSELFTHLQLGQLIIVSHERSLESMVDHVLQVSKDRISHCVMLPTQ